MTFRRQRRSLHWPRLRAITKELFCGTENSSLYLCASVPHNNGAGKSPANNTMWAVGIKHCRADRRLRHTHRVPLPKTEMSNVYLANEEALCALSHCDIPDL